MVLNGELFDIAICLETLEHVPPNLVKPYLEELSKATNGYIFISVPNEKGLVFLFKYLIKKMFGDAESYTVTEFINATLGLMHKVKRHEHKGFDYDLLIDNISKYFDIYKISGIPLGLLPTSLNFSVGIIGKKRNLD